MTLLVCHSERSEESRCSFNISANSIYERKPKVICKYCLEEVKDGAQRCPHCSSWLIEMKICPQCAEEINPQAKICRFCGASQTQNQEEVQREERLASISHKIVASPIGAMFCETSLTALFLPPELHIEKGEILVRKWTLFGLRTYDQKISINKIASVRYLSGVIWGGISIESFGGAISNILINGLDKEEAQKTVSILDEIISKR